MEPEITMSDFMKGVIAGVIASAFILGAILMLWFFQRRDKELMEYVEKQQAVEILREDYAGRDPIEFLDAIPGTRGAADDAYAEFERNRDEVLQRFRNRLADRLTFFNS